MKMTIAKRAFSHLIDELPSSSQTGLLVYGHHGDKDCSAIEILAPLAAGNGALMKEKVAELQPRKGATPLTDALFLGSQTLVEKGNGDRILVLISDGKETCGEDPVAYVQNFVDSMPADKMVRFYVIGLDVDAASKAQLEKIANIGGGAYFDAGDEQELTQALTTVANAVVKTTLFEDDFSGAFLNDAWTITNDDPDNAFFRRWKA